MELITLDNGLQLPYWLLNKTLPVSFMFQFWPISSNLYKQHQVNTANPPTNQKQEMGAE